jgi:hypothetical protein
LKNIKIKKTPGRQRWKSSNIRKKKHGPRRTFGSTGTEAPTRPTLPNRTARRHLRVGPGRTSNGPTRRSPPPYNVVKASGQSLLGLALLRSSPPLSPWPERPPRPRAPPAAASPPALQPAATAKTETLPLTQS